MAVLANFMTIFFGTAVYLRRDDILKVDSHSLIDTSLFKLDRHSCESRSPVSLIRG